MQIVRILLSEGYFELFLGGFFIKAAGLNQGNVLIEIML